MPTKAPHNCRHGRCPNLVPSGQSYCDSHKGGHIADYARRHPEYNKLYTPKHYRAYRRMFLNRHPLCANYAECGNSATVLDHIVDHGGDLELFNNPENHQALCKQCHDKKTAKSKGWGKNI